ncbi:MAG: sensor histidine kinase [Terracidiphilus sp.]|jgi:signal transduction histidine kinase
MELMMRQTGQAAGIKSGGLAAAGLVETAIVKAGLTGAGRAGSVGSGNERQRVVAVVETLANLRAGGESLAEVAHDARNMVTALGLYCDLLEEPGVLNPSYQHYGNELRLVATASRRLVEKLVALDAQGGPISGASRSDVSRASRKERIRRWDLKPAEPINNLAGEFAANRNLLAALAGPSIRLTVEAEGGALPVRLNGEDLTRILVNLVKNAAEAMPGGGRIQLGLRENRAKGSAAGSLTLTVEDNGPGIPKEALDKVFDSGYTSHSSVVSQNGGWPASHRGLGLSITRSIVEAAGGSVHAANSLPVGARFEIELPVRSRGEADESSAARRPR